MPDICQMPLLMKIILFISFRPLSEQSHITRYVFIFTPLLIYVRQFVWLYGTKSHAVADEGACACFTCHIRSRRYFAYYHATDAADYAIYSAMSRHGEISCFGCHAHAMLLCLCYARCRYRCHVPAAYTSECCSSSACWRYAKISSILASMR